MDADRLSSYRTVKELTARLGPAKLTEDESRRLVDAAEALMLEADDAAELRARADELIGRLLADRPSWKGADGSAEQLRAALRGCGSLVAA